MSKKLTEAQARVEARKPAIHGTLRDIASGAMLVTQDGTAGFLDEYRGRQFRDPDNGLKLLVPGVMTLIWAGYLDQFCRVTDAGRAALASPAPKRET